jgi:uncharacterized protein YcfJ
MSKKAITGIAVPMAAVLGLSACVGAVAPTVAVMPSPNKPLNIFQQDSADCQQYADGLITPIRTAANNQAVASAVIGAALGAALGASIGGGRGAGIGAAAGAISGTNVGVINASFAGMTIQQQFDIAYSQCMYTRGNQIPGFQANTYALPPPPSYGAARSAPPPGYAAPPSGSAPPPRAS